MKAGHRATSGLGIILSAVLAAGCRTTATFDAAARGSLGESIIADWSPALRVTAASLIEEYGPPDALASGALGWKSRGRWKRIVLWDDRGGPDGGGSLQQTVAYRVPEGRRAALEAIIPGVIVSRDGTEISARSGSESLNYLALNLADEVARGVRDPAAARRFRERTAALAASGKSSPYLERLLFPAGP